jgi:hypothetical protein
VPSFAIIAEGVTDQAVLENILLGYFGDDEGEPVVNHVQPPRDAMAKGSGPAPGGWTLVFRSLRQGDHRKALQWNDYVVIHIDTDRCTDPGFDVSDRASDGQPPDPETLIDQVRLRLVREMGHEFYEQHGARIVFAIAVDEIECWLLPLLYDGEAAKKAKITGCLEAADWKLRRLKRPPLSTAGNKSLASYEKVSREYTKRRKLMEHRGENPSLDTFVRNLEALGAASTAETGSSPGNVQGAPAQTEERSGSGRDDEGSA